MEVLKVKTLKPQRLKVEADDGRAFELRTPDDDAVAEFYDLAPPTEKGADGQPVVRSQKQNRPSVRFLVGACLFDGDGRPVGADFVKDNFTWASASDMFVWLVNASGLTAKEADLKN